MGTVIKWRSFDVLNTGNGEVLHLEAPCAECAVLFAAENAGDREATVVYGKHMIGCGDFAVFKDGRRMRQGYILSRN